MIKPRSSGESLPVVDPDRQPPTSGIEKAINSRAVVLVLSFAVLGVFGIPLLWVSRGFSRKEKIVWSMVVTLYTLLLVGIAAGCVWLAWQQWTTL